MGGCQGVANQPTNRQTSNKYKPTIVQIQLDLF